MVTHWNDQNGQNRKKKHLRHLRGVSSINARDWELSWSTSTNRSTFRCVYRTWCILTWVHKSTYLSNLNTIAWRRFLPTYNLMCVCVCVCMRVLVEKCKNKKMSAFSNVCIQTCAMACVVWARGWGLKFRSEHTPMRQDWSNTEWLRYTTHCDRTDA
jgi:hypothetical protein